MRRAVTWASQAPVTSLVDWSEAHWRDYVAPANPDGQRSTHNVVAFRFIADTRFALEHLLIADDPWADQYPRETWDLRHLALAEGESRYLRFGSIPQPWLRELTKRWCRWRISTGISVNTVANNLRSLVHFARHLPPNAAPADLTRARIETWIAVLSIDYPDVYTRRTAVNALGRLLTDTRAHDWQPDLPRNAVVYNDAPALPPAKPRWISEHLMRQLENPSNLALIPSDDLRLMIPLLISCGLRMKDARRLRFDCVTHDDTGSPTWRGSTTRFTDGPRSSRSARTWQMRSQNSNVGSSRDSRAGAASCSPAGRQTSTAANPSRTPGAAASWRTGCSASVSSTSTDAPRGSPFTSSDTRWAPG